MVKGAAQGQRGRMAPSDASGEGWTPPPSSAPAAIQAFLPGGFHQGQGRYTQASHGSLVQAHQLLSRADPAPLSHSLLKAPPASPGTSSPAPWHGKMLTCGASAEAGGEQGENTSAGILQRRSRPGNWEQAQWSRTEPPDTAGLACEAVIPIALI